MLCKSVLEFQSTSTGRYRSLRTIQIPSSSFLFPFTFQFIGSTSHILAMSTRKQSTRIYVDYYLRNLFWRTWNVRARCTNCVLVDVTLLSLGVGMGLFDSSGKALSTKYIRRPTEKLLRWRNSCFWTLRMLCRQSLSIWSSRKSWAGLLRLTCKG